MPRQCPSVSSVNMWAGEVIDGPSHTQIDCAQSSRTRIQTVWHAVDQHVSTAQSSRLIGTGYVIVLVCSLTVCVCVCQLYSDSSMSLYCQLGEDVLQLVSPTTCLGFYMQWWGNLSGGNWRDLTLKASRCEPWIHPTIHLSATFSFHLQPECIRLARSFFSFGVNIDWEAGSTLMISSGGRNQSLM